MIKNSIAIGLIFFSILSCAGLKRSDSPAAKTGSLVKQKPLNIICRNTITHPFSNTEYPDTFKIWIQDDSLLKSNVHFEIINYAGVKIYSTEFQSLLLLNYKIGPEANDSEKEQFIKKRLRNFFSEDNFMSPAIKAGESFDQDYSDKVIWEEIRHNKNSVGFTYLIGEEDRRSIAYSKKQKKAVIYFKCC